MEYIEFLEAVEAGLRVKLGAEIKIDAHELLKNNVRREVMMELMGVGIGGEEIREIPDNLMYVVSHTKFRA